MVQICKTCKMQNIKYHPTYQCIVIDCSTANSRCVASFIYLLSVVVVDSNNTSSGQANIGENRGEDGFFVLRRRGDKK